MRPLSALALVVSVLPGGCANFVQSTPFETVDHLHTTTPRTLAEGGHSSQALPPAGTSWQLALSGVTTDSTRGIPSRHYQLDVVLVDRRSTEAPDAPLRLVLHNAALVDDEGRAFAPTEIITLDEDDNPSSSRGVRRYRVRFDVPLTYRFQRVARATLHWGVQRGDGRVMNVSSRFRL